jgi:uncharacterized protein (TIGR02246 family)
MRTAALLACLFLSACQTPPPPGFAAEDRAAIEEIAARYLATARAGDWDGWTDLWTEDAVYMVPDAPSLVGKAEIRASLDVFAGPPMEMTLDLQAADGVGKWAWGRGSFTFAMAATEEMPEMRMEGSFLWVLEKQADGTWLIDSECYNSDAPLPGPDAEG